MGTTVFLNKFGLLTDKQCSKVTHLSFKQTTPIEVQNAFQKHSKLILTLVLKNEFENWITK